MTPNEVARMVAADAIARGLLKPASPPQRKVSKALISLRRKQEAQARLLSRKLTFPKWMAKE